ncbi:MAG: DNA methyltransferase [Ignavibacteriae bacterium]|nr:DNA methyltransferase [Ignavibacteriota bacterium]
MKTLFFGDCLTYLKDLVPNPHKSEGFIDLIYIDPPFNSKRDYNILFEDIDLKDATAQKQAFADTWSNVSYIDTLCELNKLDLNLYTFLETLNNINISKSAVSYLTTMAIRTYYIHKVLKDTGSFYLHCDDNMSHYLKIVCDLVFSENNFRNDITWKRFNFHADAKRFGRVTDRILFYTKSDNFIFNKQVVDFLDKYIDSHFTLEDENGKFSLDNLNPPGGRGPVYEFHGITRPWRFTKEKMEQFDKDNRIYKDGKTPRLKRYLNELEGQAVTDSWIDIPSINSQAKERLHYPTQKPEALLERIIKASSNEGDLVADFFCGCGTSIAVAERLNRQWLGVDISHLAIKLIKKRLTDKIETTELRKEYSKSIEIKGFPQDIASAHALAKEDYDIEDGNSSSLSFRHVLGRNPDETQAKPEATHLKMEITEVKDEKRKTKGRVLFQEWIVEVMLGAVLNPKLTADGGWDGHQVFDIGGDKKETVLIEVKSGHCNVKNIREFIHVVDAQKAAIGVFVCFGEQVTRPMLEEATKQGYYEIQNVKNKYPKIQILTVEDILNGQEIKMPPTTADVFKKSQKSTTQKPSKQQKIF